MTSEETAQILSHGRQRVPSPLQCQTMARADVREFLALFGNVGLDALGSPDARPLSRVFEGPFQENGPVVEEQELITGPPILRSLGKWVPVTSPSLEMSMGLERSVWANHLWNPTISVGMAYLIFKTPGLPQDGLGRATLPTATRERRVFQRLARGSIGSFVWDSGARDQKTWSFVFERNSETARWFSRS